jgi:hypothetical protein
MFRVIKKLRSYNQLEHRYLVQGTFQYKYHIAVSYKELEINSALTSIRTEAWGSKEYLLNKYK